MVMMTDDENDQNDSNLNFIEENPNEPSSSGFDAPETEDPYNDPKVPIIDFNENFN
jgi:hypothetical protein